jgi:hypothetical protein
MIGKYTYEEVGQIIEKLKQSLIELRKLTPSKQSSELNDFVATVESYYKYLESTIEMNSAADKTLSFLKETL